MTPAYLPPVSKPPHDPFRFRLDRRAGWRTLTSLSKDTAETPDDGALALVPVPGSGALLNDPSGSFGGITWPDNVVMLPGGDLVLLDRRRGVLRRFNPCCCCFEDWPCLGHDPNPKDPRSLLDPGGMATGCGQIYLCDTGHRRVLVFSPQSGALRAIWTAPVRPGLVPWQPEDVAVTRLMEVIVSDPANGGVHVFSALGVYRRFFGNLGAVSSVAVDDAGHLYVRVNGQPDVLVLDVTNGRVLQKPIRPDEVTCKFPLLPVNILANGAFDVSALCSCPPDPPLVIDAAGNPVAAEDFQLQFPKQGDWVSLSLDSEISRCRWHRVVLWGILPVGVSVDVFSLTDESDQPSDLLALKTPEEWRYAGTWSTSAECEMKQCATDFLLHSPHGRYLWLKLVLRGHGATTPRICALEVEFPRISLRRYLPALFGAEPVSADFTDRWLAIFDRGFRDLESAIDTEASLFDPLACPSNFLNWLAQWVGVTLERSWTEARRRIYLKHAPRLFPWIGTVHGIRQSVYLFLGLERYLDFEPQSAECVPCPLQLRTEWHPPRLILEHFKLRHWLFVNHARLSDNARLWGERIVNRSRLGGPLASTATDAPTGAQLGVTQLKKTQDPCRDPFHVYAHKLSIFVPASCVSNPTLSRALERLVELQKPAHVEARIIPVEPRFRVGVQAMLGLDAVIGWRAKPIQLDEVTLAHGTVLEGAIDDRPRFRLGDARIGQKTILTTKS